MTNFTNPVTWATNQRVLIDDLRTALRDNLNGLKYPPTAIYNTTGRSSDYSTTSTSFADVDSTNMALSITTTGNGAGGAADVFIWLTGTVYSASNIRIYFRVTEDSVALNADDGLFVSEGSGVRPVSFMLLRANATAGTHSYKLQWRVSGGTGFLQAAVGTAGRDCRTQFGVREMS